MTLEDWLAGSFKNTDSPVTNAELRVVESQIGYSLPEELRRILNLASAPEGFVGESYIAFFGANEVLQCCCEARDTADGFVPFASNGGGEWYGLDSRREPSAYVLMPSVGMAWEEAKFLGTNWAEFWETLRSGKLFDRSSLRS